MSTILTLVLGFVLGVIASVIVYVAIAELENERHPRR